MNIEETEFKGVKCVTLSNDIVELIITTQFGPRVLFYGFKGGQNFFRIFDDQLSDVRADEWQSYGGHRLWHAPEVYPRTYYPDNDQVEYDWDGNVLTLRSPIEQKNGIEKMIGVKLSKNSSEVELFHTIWNRNVWNVELSSWCLSVMAPGGCAIIPQESYIPHGEGAGETFLPARNLVVWPFTFMGDSRFTWGNKYIQMREDDSLETKQKIGMDNTLGWIAYTLNNEVFIKKFDYDKDAVYPDNGCNCELFTMPGFLEVETLSPLKNISPGDAIIHRENWSLAKVAVDNTEESIDKNILPLI